VLGAAIVTTAGRYVTRKEITYSAPVSLMDRDPNRLLLLSLLCFRSVGVVRENHRLGDETADVVVTAMEG